MARIVAGADLYPLLDSSLRPALRAIGLSLGPDARTVLFGSGGQSPIGRATTGFAIARAMPIPSGPMGVAPRLLNETLFAADRDFGDGTARLALIAGACFSAGAREVVAGIPLRPLCESIASLTQEIASQVGEEGAAQVDLLQIARSAGAAPALAGQLADLVAQLGGDAVFDVKENNGRGIEVTRSPGFVLDAKPLGSGSLSALSSVSVLVADEIIHDFGVLAPVLEGFAHKRKSLVIAARDIAGTALSTLRQNQQAEIVTVAALQPADAGQRAADCLEDLAIATGATLIADRFGTKLERVRPAMLGQASGFRFAGGMATFLEPKGEAQDIAFRRRLLAASAEKARHLSYDREHFERRRARLGGQWCELRVAGDSSHETDAMIKTTRAAVSAMQSAMQDGAVSGGGALYGKLAIRLAKGDSSAVAAAAERAVARGLMAIPQHLVANQGSATDAARLECASVLDPLCLTKVVINQGLGLAVSLLRAGALIAR